MAGRDRYADHHAGSGREHADRQCDEYEQPCPELVRSEVLAHVGEIDTALALGADGRSSVAPYVQTSFEASLIWCWIRCGRWGSGGILGADGGHVALGGTTSVRPDLPVLWR